jgi:hypothetical protein
MNASDIRDMTAKSGQHTIYLDENNVFVIQKLLYYFEINKLSMQATNIIATDAEVGKVGKVEVGKMEVGKVGKMEVGKMEVGKVEVGKMEVGKMEVGKVSKVKVDEVGKISTLNEYIFHGIVDVRGKKIIFLIPMNSFSFRYKEEVLVFSYNKYQKSETDRGIVIRMEQLILSGSSIEVLKDFIHEVERLEFIVPENKLIKYVWKESYWKYCNAFKRRTLDTLYLPKSYKTCVIEEIDQFYQSDKTIYEKLCIPERKVFLFWGVPGSGKTTFIRSIASHFNKNIAIVKNTHDIDDASLESMLEELPRNSLILFEDIDSLFQGRSNVANTNITFSGLLNFLDGIIDYDKLLIFITTNNLKHIDDALRRRVDIFLEFTCIKKTEIIEMFHKFFDGQYPVDIFCKKLNREITPNALEKYFMKCIIEGISPIDNIALLYTYIDITKNNNLDMYA